MPGAHHELQTLRDLLRYGVSQFHRAGLVFGHGNDNAWDEAVYLLLYTMDLPPERLELFLDARVLPHERDSYLSLIERRTVERIPAAYLTGEAWLQGQKFLVDARVIIPRSPISELLAEDLSPWIALPDRIHDVLDLCTGSGCLAILAAQSFQNAIVDAVDLSDDALSVARTNISRHGLEQRVRALRSDLFDDLEPKQYDLIISNPPYVNRQSMAALPPEYRHEPVDALDGGDDGMDLVRRIVRDAPNFLADDGILILEIGNEYQQFVAAFPQLDPVWLSTAHTDDHILMLTQQQLIT